MKKYFIYFLTALCFCTLSFGKLTAQIELPDNISDATCVAKRSKQQWSIQGIRSGYTKINPYQNAVVGDIDNDGQVEILIGIDADPTSPEIVEARWSNKIAVYRVVNGSLSHIRTIETQNTYNWDSYTKYGIVKTKIDNKDTVLIVVAEKDRKLRAYNYNGVLVWESTENYHSSPKGDIVAGIGFADFNKDGIPEIMIYGKIYNSVTGKLLCSTPTEIPIAGSDHMLNQGIPIAADVFNTGEMHLVLGNAIYKPNAALTSLSLVRKMNLAIDDTDPDKPDPIHAIRNGGRSSLVDMDLDGKLDLVIAIVNHTTGVGLPLHVYICVADPETGAIKASKYIKDTEVCGYPIVGDIDGDGKPEIVFITANEATQTNRYMYALKYNPTGANPKILEEFWKLDHTDNSGVAAMTLFDFNSDGISEIVYRDQDLLRIINGSKIHHETGAAVARPYNLASFACYAGTLTEYPVVADVDGDGQAEILIGGAVNKTDPHYEGVLWMFKSGDPAKHPWAPARKVWNQYAYNSLNINEDLTMPIEQISPATVFPGEDGVLGTSDDVRPFNNFLQQQTILNSNGIPLKLAPAALIEGVPNFEYDLAKDSMIISVKVKNTGEIALQSPFNITVYKDAIGNPQKITYKYEDDIIRKDNSVVIRFGIPKFKIEWAPFTNLVIQINDNGNGYNDQAVCDSLPRDYKVGKVIASDDRVLLFKNSSDNKIIVTANDIKSCNNPIVEIVNPPVIPSSTASVTNDSIILYSPANGYVGNDTIKYKLTCGDSHEATVYITVMEMPDNISDAECFVEPQKFDWLIKPDYQSPTETHHTYVVPLVGDIDGDKIPEIITLSADTYYLNILWGDRSKPASTIKIAAAFMEYTAGGSISPYAMYKTKINGVEKVVIAVICGANGVDLWAYDLNGPADQSTTPLWKAAITKGPLTESESVGVADFDGDGIPEVYLRNRIYCGSTGKLLVDGGTTTNTGNAGGSYFTVAADVIGDAKLELIAGSEVYSVDISDKTGALNTNKLTKEAWLKDIPILNKVSAKDGFTVIADINRDGKLDVIYASSDTPSEYKNINIKLIAWDVASGELICQSDSVSSAWGVGIPFIGNIDNTPDLEVVFMIRHKLLGYKPNFTDKKFELKYETTVIDASGRTGMTLFDFNNDKVGEIVYRDENNLRIMKANPLTNKFEDLKSYPAKSGTFYEYPVVADIDNDGAAEIVVISSLTTGDSNGSLWIYRSGSANSWAPARAVWNQYAYNAVNINEDLTVPRFQLNPATVFPGKDGVLGTADDVQPYNAFLQQQAMLSKNGIPMWLAASAQAVEQANFSYDVSKDSLIVTVKIYNAGEAALQNPVNVTAYKNNIGDAVKYTYAYPYKIMQGETATITFGIEKFKEKWTPFSDIVIQVNDNGNGYNDQPVCDSLSRNFKLGAIIATDDYTLLFENSIDNKIQVTVNDIKPCNNPKIEIVAEAKHTRPSYPSTVYNDSVIVYTPAQYYEGLDSIKYLIHCGDITKADTAYLYIKVIKAPDNISDATCVTTPPVSAWGIREVPNNLGDIFSNLQTTLVADIDGDKIPEILALSTAGDKVYVLNGDGTLKATSATFTTNPIDIKISYGGANPLAAVARVQWLPNDYKTVIFTTSSAIATADRKLRAYDASNGALLWTSTALFNDGIGDDGASVQVIDLDGDGWSELVIGNKVFSAEKGILLCSAGTNLGVIHGWGETVFLIHSMAGDVLGNGKQQVCVGNTIYEVNITNRAVSGGVNTMTPAKTITPIVWNGTANETLTTTDGAVQLADIDLDGNLDIIVSTVKRDEKTPTNSIFYMYVWSPSKNEIIASKKISRVYKRGVPFIANIDKNNPYPEIIFIRGGTSGNSADSGHDKITALQYDPSSVNKELKTFWELDHDDVSGATGITLFDFNQDKISELVYRDNKHLRIINGSGLHHVTGDPSAPYDLATINCSSATCYEYPVVADIDGDGQAEIVVTGNRAIGHSPNGPIRIFKAATGTSWAPARKVWNQYAYNAVNVNEDLTIPKVQLSPATVFPGEDGVLGTTDDTRPYNAFLQQQTMLNKFGSPLWLAANAQKLGVPNFSYDVGKDSLIVTIKIHNAGSAALQDPVKITAYKDNVGNALKHTYAYPEKIMPGDSATITFGIEKFKEKWTPFSDIVIQINDNGNGYNDQPVCDSSLRDFKSGAIIASDDRVLLFKNSSDNRITVTLNDIKSCIDPKVTIVTPPKHALSCTVVNDSVIQYRPATDYTGSDTIRYKVTCGADSHEAMVYITVIEKPDNISDANCFIKPEVKTFTIKEHASFANVHSMSTPLVANLLGNGPEIIAPRVKTNNDAWLSNGLVIANVKDNTSREISTVDFATHGQSIVIADVDNDGKCEIFIQSAINGAIHCYNTDGSVKSGFGTGGATIGLDAHYVIQLADLNNDGNVELVAGTYIFDAKTGALKLKMIFEVDGRGYGNPHVLNFGFNGYYFMPAIGDVDGDGLLEIVGGSTVYKPNAALNDYTTTTVDKVSAPAAFNRYWDGPTVLVDFDLDGQLDVCVIGYEYTGGGGGIFSNYQLYVWNPKTRQIIAYSPAVIRTVYSNTINHGNTTIPYVGDLDNNGYPDIAFASTEPAIGMATFQYDNTQPGNIKPGPIEPKFAETAGFTMFDFNQDGKAEIVYRGTSEFFIVDLNDAKNAYVELSTPMQAWSGTVSDYPIVADVDGDGQAEIILTRARVKWGLGGLDGFVSVYKTGDATKPWAPARSVWNQWNYNSVNINDDMTIPRYQINPATVFPGEDGQLGTSDDVRPYNGFLLQQTILNKNGTPLWLAPNVEIDAPAPVYTYHAVGDSLSITLTILNKGDASLQNDVYITVYKDVVNAGSDKYTYAYPEAIDKGTSVSITFSIPNFSTWIQPADNNTKLILKINDKGEAKDHQPVCETGNTTHSKLYSNLLLANHDYAHTLENNKGTIDVQGNDSIPTGCTPLITIVSQPTKGTATLNSTSDSIVYTPDANFVGHDTISYQIKCNNETSVANIYINVYEKPDNIVDPGACNVLLPSFDFKIKQQWETVNAGHSVTGTLVGDLDGDGLPEIIAYSPNLSAVNVYNGQTGAFIDSIKFTGAYFGGKDGWTPHMTSILVDADRNGLAEIIGVDTKTQEIHSYEADTTGGTLKLKWKWKAARPFENPYATDNLPHLNVADFNGDGVPELLIYNQIYNAATGAFLGETEAMATAHKGCDPGRLEKWNRSSNFQTTADFDGDGFPEIVAGGKIYKVNFNAAKDAVTCSVLKNNATVPDGFTAVADIDMDGNLDVVVVSTGGVDTIVSLYVWSPLTTWSTSKELCISPSSPSYPAHSFPFIGDIDGVSDGVTGKKHPEICVVTARNTGETHTSYVRAYKYNSATKAMVEKWELGTSDASGGTGITLFDFNNDGVNELVYRDETHLRILNGVADATPVLADPGAIFDCFSRTAFEYPVIADTDGDGSANICITCREKKDEGSHNLRVYESGSQPWAPTRRVWNQVNYEPLQINENLTVPKMAIPKNMAFNGKHPYNGALIQVPIVDALFNPVILAPDPATAGLKLEAINSTTLRVWFDIQNKGTRFTNVSLPVTLYHTSAIAANIIDTKPIGVSLASGDTVTLYWDIPSLLPYTKLIVRIQDDGAKYPADGSYLDCDYSNNIDSINVLLAVDDIRNANKNTSLTIDVLANDFYGSCGRDALTAFDTIGNSGLHLGSLTISNDSIFTYTPEANKTGVDSVDYYIKCNADSSAARVYILINNPNALNYIACLPQTPNTGHIIRPTIVNLGFTPIPDVSYTWYPSKTSTIPVTGGVNKDTLTVEVKDTTDFGSWWVEPVWKGIKFERIEVTLSESSSCGEGLSDCAIDGTVLFRENFGGTDPADPIVKLTGIPEVSTPPYKYNAIHGSLLAGYSGKVEYTITKEGRGGGGTQNDWWRVPDHIYPGETHGYMLQVNADLEPGQYYERQLTGLCAGNKLFFSAWIINVQKNVYAGDKVNARFLIEHNDIVIAEYTTGAILESEKDDSTHVKWRMYGFDFIVPVGVDNLKLRVINDGTGSSGNDFAMDDIEIRFCAPRVKITPGKDSMVCQGSRLDLNSSYTDDGQTFGQALKGRWERLDESDGKWKLYKTEFSSNIGVIDLPITINSFQAADEGYYRVVIGSVTSIDEVNCRAVSDSVRFKFREVRYSHPDIRVQTCTDIGNINLSSYLDTVDFKSVQWFTAADVPMSNELNTGTLGHTNTYKYKYKIENYCYSPEGILYIKTLNDKSFNLPPDSVVICYKYANELHLNRIFGLEAKGTIEAEHAAIDNYVETAVSPALYYGATIFDGKAVYENAAISGVAFDYNGPLTSGIAKKVTFKYTPAAGSCLAGKVYRLTVILTDDIL